MHTLATLRSLRCLLALIALVIAQSALAQPALMLANVYRSGLPLHDYWVSEKYDGVRGYWDGRQLLTRGGQRIQAPPWFTQGWPATALDGELWAGRGRFNETVSTVRSQTPDDAAWRRLRFMVFDAPQQPGPFDDRLNALQILVRQVGQPWLQAVAQQKVANDAALQRLLRQVVKAGGEGLMLHRGGAAYQALRNDDLLKLKPFDDAEARVLAHLPGQGKHQGRLGALLVETPAGQRFRIGTGFSDSERANPPAVGQWITYRHQGLNPSGIPRFARYLRVSEDQNLNERQPSP